jgi:uncharacterized protein (TIGR03437 family)
LRLLTIICCLILASISAYGQIMIDTFAGGYIQSGISAQNVAFGFIVGVTRDPKGNLVFCDASNNVIRRINADGTVQTIAGLGIPGYSGDGAAATSALLNNPAYPNYDSAGNLYFADAGNYRIRRIDASGNITTVAGTGIQPSEGTIGPLGANGPAAQAQIGDVSGLAIDTAGYVYFIDTVNQLRRITPSGGIEYYPNCSGCIGEILALAADSAGNLYTSDFQHIYRISSDGVVHNFAGFGNLSTPNMGNGGTALNAPPSAFALLAADSAGNVYTEEVSLTIYDSPFIIRRIGTDGIINVVAGSFTGTLQTDGPALQAELFQNYGFGLTADASGTVTFVEDYRLRQLTTQSTIQTIAGNQPLSAQDGSPALNAWFIGPNSIAFDGAGNLYVGQTCMIQKVDSSGLVSTVAGTGQCSTTPPSGPALTTELTAVSSIALDSHGQVYFADIDGTLYVVSTEGLISKVVSVAEAGLPKIAIDSQDRVYVISMLGVFVQILPGSQPQLISLPVMNPLAGQAVAITVDSSDNVYVCCTANHTIYRLTPDFQVTALTVEGPEFVSALAVDASSNIWQGTTFTGSTNGGLTKGALPFGAGCCLYGDGGAAESAYIVPSALAFAPNGDLYFLDESNGRVRRIHGSPPTVPPAISSGGIVNAASLAGAAIAPGELITIFGSNFGPPGLDLSSPQNNVIPKALNNVHVYFGLGNEGAITARTPTQINVFVPYDVANDTSVQVIVDVDGVTSTPVTVPVALSAFGLSTADSSGSGQGAIFNQDGSYNSPSNPAARGSIVTLFGTGEGVTTPALPDGALVISTPYSTTQSPVTVTFGGQTAEIQYAGAAPFLPTGVFQINATIPADVPSGDVPITVSIGGISTTKTVTVSVE